MKRSHGIAALVFALAAGVAGCTQEVGVKGEPGVVNVRRITESQYRHTVADLFGDKIAITGRFEPEMRDEGLLAIGSAKLSITPSGFEQYFAIASNVSNAAVSEDNREKIVPCTPADPKAADDACARQTLAHYGRLLFRRPLSETELAARVSVASATAGRRKDFYSGLAEGFTGLLVAPEFLFRIESAEAFPSREGEVRLDGYTKAARLSYFFWDTTPDDELLNLAATGDIHKHDILRKQIDRLSSSPKLEQGARAFFDDMLQNDLYATLTKDPLLYPKFSLAVAESAREQTLKTLVDHLITRKRDYRDIFTTRDTFLDRSLAAIYKVPYLGDGDWVSYTVPEDLEAAGILTQAGFLSLFSHPGRSSPTKRGVAVNEIFLCTPTPLPPANVDFSIVNDTQNPNMKTVRQRLLAHSLDESCASCHNLSDPLGLSLERFDSIGQFRMAENDEVIDVSARLDGKEFEGGTGLGETLHDDKRAPRCLVRNVFAYATGRASHPEDDKFIDAQTNSFKGSGYVYPDLLKRIARTNEFFGFEAVTPRETQTADATRTQTTKAEGGLQ
jgi:hypothetical protein